MAKNRVAEYLGNLGKSITFAAVDELPKSMQSSSEFINTNASSFKDVFVAVKDYKNTFDKAAKMVFDSKIFKAADVAWKSTKESIKTGNFYSKEREEKYSMEALGELGDFSDMDINFDDLDNKIQENSKSQSDADIISSRVEKSNYNSAEATCNMIANSTDYIVSTNRSNSKILAAQNANIMGMLSKGFNSTNESISKISSVMTGPMMAHLDNSKKAYEKLTSGVDAIVTILSEMNERQKSAYAPQNNQSKQKIGLEDIMTSSGAVDIKSYLNLIKKNIKSAAGPMGNMLFGNGMGEDSNVLLTFAANPLAILPQMLIKSLTPNSLKRSMQNFDNTMSGLFSTFIGQMNKLAKNDENGILSTIGKIFGINNKFKTSIDTSLYKKGAIPFDGETKKAITEVIPTYLRKIEKTLTNSKNENIFDYDKGKWVSDSDIYERGSNIKSNSINEAFSDIIPELRKYLSSHASNDKYDEDKMQKSMMNMLEKIFDDYGYIDFNNKKIRSKFREYGVDSEEYFRVLLGALQTLPRNMTTSMARNVMSARSETTRNMQKLEESGNDILNMYFNGSIDKNTLSKSGIDKFANKTNIISLAIDEKGNNIFYYLRTIASEIHDMRINGSRFGADTLSTNSYKGILLNNGQYSKSVNNTKPINDNWLDTVVDNNKEAKKYKNNKERENEQYTKHIASLKLAKGDKKLLVQYYNTMDDHTANQIVSQMKSSEYDRYLEQAKHDYETDSKFQQVLTRNSIENQFNKGKGLINRLIDARSLKDKLDVVKQQASDIAKIPSSAIEKILNVADNKMYELMFGYKDTARDSEGKPIEGFIGRMLYELKGSFAKFNTFIDEKILNPIKEKLGIEKFSDIFTKILDKLGFNKDKRSKIKENLKVKVKPFTNSIKRSFGDLFQDTKSAVIDTANNIISMTKGTPLKGSDNLVTEENSGNNILNRILNSTGVRNEVKDFNYFKRLNPNATNAQLDKLYRENTRAEHDKKQQMYDELFGGVNNNANGSKYVENSGLTTISKGELIIPSELNPFNKDAGKVNKDSEIRNEKNIKNKFIRNILDKSIKSRAEGTDKLSDKIPPELKAKLKNIGKNVEEYGPNAVGKGAIGAVGALLSGINPLLGLALGGFVGVAQKSSKIQDWLFGIEENGERTGGVISKELQEKFNKTTRTDMKRLGLTGMALSLITPLGPIGGLMVGSALGFAKNNKTITNFLFGELDEETGKRLDDGIIPPNVVEFVKKAAPNIAIGTISSLVLGPFGFLGNAVLGSGLGLVSATDNFQTWLFGDKDDDGKRHGGALDKLKNGFMDFAKDKILNPLSRFIKPVGQMIKNGIKSIAIGVQDTINGILEKALGTPLGQWFKEKILDPGGKVLSGLFRFGLNIGKKGVALPFSILGGIGDRIRRKQINKGTATDMSADERLAFMQTNGGLFNKSGRYKMRDVDKLISGQEDDDIDTISNLLGRVVNNKSQISKTIRGTRKSLFKDIDNYLKENNIKMSPKNRDTIIKLAESGNIKDVKHIRRILGKNNNLTQDQAEGLFNILNRGSQELHRLNESKSIGNLSLDEATVQLERLGIKGVNRKNVRKYYEMYNSENKFRKNISEDDKKEKEPIQEIQEDTKEIIDVLNNILMINKALLTGDKSEIEAKLKQDVEHGKVLAGHALDNINNSNAENNKEDKSEPEAELNKDVKHRKIRKILVGQYALDNTNKSDNSDEIAKADGESKTNTDQPKLIPPRKSKIPEFKTDTEQQKEDKGITEYYNPNINKVVEIDNKDGSPVLKTEEQKENNKNITKPISLLSKIKDGVENTVHSIGKMIFGKKNYETGKYEGGALSFLPNILIGGKKIVDKILDPIKKIGLIILGLSGFGHLTGWWNNNNIGDKLKGFISDKIINPLAKVFLGTKNDNGYYQGGLRGLLFGSKADSESDYEGGLFPGIANKIDGIFTEYIKPTWNKHVQPLIDDFINEGFIDGIVKKRIIGSYNWLWEVSGKSGHAEIAANKYTGIGGFILQGLNHVYCFGKTLWEEKISPLLTELFSSIPGLISEWWEKRDAYKTEGANTLQSNIDSAVDSNYKKMLENANTMSNDAFYNTLTNDQKKIYNDIISNSSKYRNKNEISAIEKEYGIDLGDLKTDREKKTFAKYSLLKLTKDYKNNYLLPSNYEDDGLLSSNYDYGYLFNIKTNAAPGYSTSITAQSINKNDKIIIFYDRKYTDKNAKILYIAKSSGFWFWDTQHYLNKIKLPSNYYKVIGMEEYQKNSEKYIPDPNQAAVSFLDYIDKVKKVDPDNPDESCDAYRKPGFYNNSGDKVAIGTIDIKQSDLDYYGLGRGENNHNKLSGGFSLQKNNPYSNMRYGNSTIAEEGCAPVAASSLLGINIKDAASYAQANGFVDPNGGTNINYFNSLLSSQGIQNVSSNNPNDVKNTLQNGGKAVLLGKDSTGGIDKPFSDRMHFITAEGMDNNGNIIINDPDLGRRKMSSNKVLKGMKSSVLVGGARINATNLTGSYTNSKNTSNSTTNTIDYYKNNIKYTIKYDKYVTMSKNINNIQKQDLGSWSAITVDELKSWIRTIKPGSKFLKYADAFIYAANMSGLDPRYLVAHAAVETGWGTSNICMTKNNFFGIGAFDNNPGNASTFKDSYSGIVGGAKWIANNYYNNNNQTTLWKMRYGVDGHNYCTSLSWVSEISRIMSTAPINIAIRYIDNSMKINGSASTNSSNISTSIPNYTYEMTYRNADSTISSENTTGETTSTTSTKPTLLDMISKLGRSILNSVWGKDRVNALIGNDKEDINTSSENTTNTSNTTNSNTTEQATKIIESIQKKYNPVTVTDNYGYTLKNNFPYYSQRDPRWANVMYSAINDPSQTIDRNGCGPTSMAMILSSFGKNTNPVIESKWSADRKLLTNGGATYYEYLTRAAKEYGLIPNYLGTGSSINKVWDAVNKGIPVMASMGPGAFTTGGHFINIVGANGDKFLVNDGYSEKNTNKEWDENTIKNQAKYFWSFTDQEGLGPYETKMSGAISGAGRSSNNSLNATKYMSNNAISMSNRKSTNTPLVGDGRISNNKSGTSNSTNNSSLYTTSDTYVRMMSAIVEILCRIADNTDKLSEISRVLSNKLNINITPDELSKIGKSRSDSISHSSSIKSALSNSIKNNLNNSIPISNDVDNFKDKDTEYIIRAMKAIAMQ